MCLLWLLSLVFLHLLDIGFLILLLSSMCYGQCPSSISRLNALV
uniref:Uncharacterized protein n=1 Tax=Rhizophora mucronata TaxID=61149 RepID=A0A2P2QC71_RHIMU